MFTISSVSVSPWPQSPPTVKPQPVMPTKQSKAVSSENAGASLPVTQVGENNKALTTYAPSTLAPVAPTGEASNTTVLANAAVPERTGVPAQQPAPPKMTYPGQLPEPYKTPDVVAMEKQINEFVPNLWKASRAAVDVLIGEDAQAAAMAARTQAYQDRAASKQEAAESAAADSNDSYGGSAGSLKTGGVLNTKA